MNLKQRMTTNTVNVQEKKEDMETTTSAHTTEEMA